jgi:hypothetical protein
MKLEITKLIRGGREERVVLKAIETTNLCFYQIVDTTYVGDSVSDRFRHLFWFPDYLVEKGDIVVLYTKTGLKSVKQNKDKRTHFFYWNVKNSVWNDDADAVKLVQIAKISARGYRQLEEKIES